MKRTRKMKTVHYRVMGERGPKVFGCGHSGSPNSVRTSEWQSVTCASCKRTPEWKRASLPSGDTKEPSKQVSMTIVRDRVTERLVIERAHGTVFIRREYQADGEWRVDPEAGIAFGAEYTDEMAQALLRTADSSSTDPEKK